MNQVSINSKFHKKKKKNDTIIPETVQVITGNTNQKQKKKKKRKIKSNNNRGTMTLIGYF